MIKVLSLLIIFVCLNASVVAGNKTPRRNLSKHSPEERRDLERHNISRRNGMRLGEIRRSPAIMNLKRHLNDSKK